MKTLLLSLPLLALMVACKKEDASDRDTLPPATHLILLDKNGSELLTSTTTALTVATAINGNLVAMGQECAAGECSMIRSYSTNSNQPYRFAFTSVGMTSENLAGHYDWYLTMQGKTDTLHYELQPAPATANTELLVTKASFNGRPVQTDAQLDNQFGHPVFVLKRQR